MVVNASTPFAGQLRVTTRALRGSRERSWTIVAERGGKTGAASRDIAGQQQVHRVMHGPAKSTQHSARHARLRTSWQSSLDSPARERGVRRAAPPDARVCPVRRPRQHVLTWSALLRGHELGLQCSFRSFAGTQLVIESRLGSETTEVLVVERRLEQMSRCLLGQEELPHGLEFLFGAVAAQALGANDVARCNPLPDDASTSGPFGLEVGWQVAKALLHALANIAQAAAIPLAPSPLWLDFGEALEECVVGGEGAARARVPRADPSAQPAR